MKRCPECRRDYTDETLNFCLDDGATLLEGPASVDGTPTAILSEPPAAAGGLSVSATVATAGVTDSPLADPIAVLHL